VGWEVEVEVVVLFLQEKQKTKRKTMEAGMSFTFMEPVSGKVNEYGCICLPAQVFNKILPNLVAN